MDTLTKFSIPITSFLLTIIFGFWLAKVGKPYNGLLFNIHKLIALGAMIITSIRIYDALKEMSPQALVISLIVVSVLAVIALFASGAFLSVGNLQYEILKLIHTIAFVVLSLTAGSAIYLIHGKIS